MIERSRLWHRIGILAACVLLAHASASADERTVTRAVRLITLDPGHFHAALVQKYMYPEVDPVVHIYAPAGEDLSEHLKRIDSFNKRAQEPTSWRSELHTGPDYFERMLVEKPGNVVVISGNNARKADYIQRSVAAGLHVLADKPMAIVPADLERLRDAFKTAAAKRVLLYDIMTERFEITSVLQRELAQQPALFGELVPGSPDEPAIVKESVHHYSKIVAGAPLRRPQWFFDARQAGEGIVDVTTHLVDLVQWQAFPEVALKPEDAVVLKARRWNTQLTPAQFEKVTGQTSVRAAGEGIPRETGAKRFPEYLNNEVRDGVLNVPANGEFTYRLRGIHARISVGWNFEAPTGAGDTHYSRMRGTKSSLIIRQGAQQRFKPVLYIEKAQSVNAAAHDAAVQAAMVALQGKFPGVGARRDGDHWAVSVPEKYDVGHEAHFTQVTQNFLSYMRTGRLPGWEVPNMLTKYATIMQAYELSRAP